MSGYSDLPNKRLAGIIFFIYYVKNCEQGELFFQKKTFKIGKSTVKNTAQMNKKKSMKN